MTANDDSLGEEIQRALAAAGVVRAVHTVCYAVMRFHPERGPGQHSTFLAGNDQDAEGTVRDLVASFGWPDGSIVDLGDVTTARENEPDSCSRPAVANDSDWRPFSLIRDGGHPATSSGSVRRV
jgi:predicted dinucleotide-binding enzyme